MDNLTHSLTGLMLARAGLGRTTERGGTLMLVLAANAPDLDGLALFGGNGAYLEYHRGLMHSFAFPPVMALLSLLLAKWIRGATISLMSWFACVLGVLSHLLLDFTNVYGIRLFLPFSTRMPHLDITEIIDPWILLIFALALAAPALSGLVTSEIRGAKSASPKRAWAVFALVALCGYEGFRFAAHQRAIAVMGARTYAGPTTLIAAMPNGSNPLRWRGVVETGAETGVETGTEVLTIPILLSEEFDPGQAEIDYPAPDSPALEAARAAPGMQPLVRFDQLPFWSVTPVEGGTVVHLVDMRFGTPRQRGLFSAAVFITDGGRVVFPVPRELVNP
jgi:inner membrane protein